MLEVWKKIPADGDTPYQEIMVGQIESVEDLPAFVKTQPGGGVFETRGGDQPWEIMWFADETGKPNTWHVLREMLAYLRANKHWNPDRRSILAQLVNNGLEALKSE